MTAPPIKMLTLDLDGTVFRNDKTISQHTKDAIAAAIAKGVVVIPATGRALNGLPEEILALEGIQYALTSNGAAIWSLKDRKKLVDLPFSTQDTIAAMELMEAYDCMLDVYLDGKVYTSFSMLAKAETFAPPEMLEYVRKTRTAMENPKQYIVENGYRAEKVTMFFRDEQQRQKAIAQAQALPWIEPTSSVPGNLELNAAGVDKGKGLGKLAEFLQIPIEQVMACGDGGNDIAMLQTAGWGVAMGNAPLEVQQAAKAVTLTNQQDGVAHAIETYILSI